MSEITSIYRYFNLNNRKILNIVYGRSYLQLIIRNSRTVADIVKECDQTFWAHFVKYTLQIIYTVQNCF